MQEYLAIASVPVQSWGGLFTPEEALRTGTIFQDLNKPFFAASDSRPADPSLSGAASADPASPIHQYHTGTSEQPAPDHTVPPEQQRPEHTVPLEQPARERMLLKIQETGFVLDDLRLYLDTHSDDRQGTALLKDKLREQKELLRKYALQFCPLTPGCAAGICEKEPAPDCWCWQKGPMPWEGACV